MMSELLLCGFFLAQSSPGTSERPSEMEIVEQRLQEVRNAPADPRARLELAKAYADSEEYELAMSELVEAINLNPENAGNLNAEANFQLGLVLSVLERPALATKAYREALRLGLQEASVYTALGGSLAAEGKYADATAEYRQAVTLAPDSFEAHSGLAVVLEAAGQLDEAVTQYEAALRLVPQAGDDHVSAAIRERLAVLKDRRRL